MPLPHNVRGTQELLLGGNNTITADTLAIGGFKMTGAMRFRTGLSGGTITMRGSAGGADRVKVLGVGDHRAGVTDYFSGGTSATVSADSRYYRRISWTLW